MTDLPDVTGALIAIAIAAGTPVVNTKQQKYAVAAVEAYLQTIANHGYVIVKKADLQHVVDTSTDGADSSITKYLR